MKKSYVRPSMESEVFVTNAYCGACSEQPPVLTGNLLVDVAQGNWYSDNNGAAWNPGRYTFDTSHTFVEANKKNQNSNFGNLKQYYWECSCTDHDGRYYLEYSANFTENYNNGTPTFFLYKETTGNRRLDLGTAQQWPSSANGNADQVVAQVKFTAESNPVVNS